MVTVPPTSKPASRYAYRVTDHYGNNRLMTRAERDAAAQQGRVWDSKRVRVPSVWGA